MIFYRSLVSESSVTGLGVHTRWCMFGNITLHSLCYLARVRPVITSKFVTPTAPSCIDNSWRSTTPLYGKPFGFLVSISRYRELFPDIGNSNSRYRELLPRAVTIEGVENSYLPGNVHFQYRPSGHIGVAVVAGAIRNASRWLNERITWCPLFGGVLSQVGAQARAVLEIPASPAARGWQLLHRTGNSFD